MKSLLIALAFCASCCLSAEEIVPQSIPAQETQAIPAAEPQTMACPCCDCEEEAETTECACSRCGKSATVLLAGCGCKNKGKVLVNQQETATPVVEETEAAAEEQVA
jgi:hypothetical protein